MTKAELYLELLREIFDYLPPASSMDGEHKKPYRAIVARIEEALEGAGRGEKEAFEASVQKNRELLERLASGDASSPPGSRKVD